MIDFLLILNSS